MAELLIRSYTLLVQEKEAFSGHEDQIKKVVNKLKLIGESSDDKGFWINEVRDVINDMEAHIDKYLSQKGKHEAEDQKTLIDGFRNDMQKIEIRLSETIQRKTQLDCSTNSEDDIEDNKSSHGMKEGQTSASSSSTLSLFESEFINLTDCVRDCLMYCCIFPDNYLIRKGKFTRLLVAEGLIEEKEGKLAEEHIGELVNKGMLELDHGHSDNGTKLLVLSIYCEFCLRQIKEGKLKLSTSVPQKARSVVSNLDKLIKIDNLQLWSLFLIGNQGFFEERSDWLKFESAKFLRVLDL
ncbi:hypothetical protein PanWU01x14_066470 [Parasponia andersonii]|uniref:Uncharacterized protein n=1 Tax=Parasponia andersonii TaxID=3476 RepID=A0A2P5DG52_PARAD|nr:hypothetical protein PanWU01x14_066470 [Parasponia andersonii]